MLTNDYRSAFKSFVKNGNIGPFAEKKALTGDQVQTEIDNFKASRDRYESFDQGDHDQNPDKGSVKVATSVAFPEPTPPAEYADFVNQLDSVMEDLDMKADTSNDFLNVEMTDNGIEVEETGTTSGVYFTEVQGNDTYYMGVTFDGNMDVVEAIHVNSASGTGSSSKIRYQVPEEDPQQPNGQVIADLGNGASIRADDDGILRFDF